MQESRTRSTAVTASARPGRRALAVAAALLVSSATVIGSTHNAVGAAADAAVVVVSTEPALRDAVADAAPGTVIRLTGASQGGPVDGYRLTAPLTIRNADVQIVGAENSSQSSADFVLDGGGGRALIVDAPGVTVRGVTIRNAARPNGSGAAVTVKRSIEGFRLVDSSVVDNSARAGAGMIVSNGASARVERSTFARNAAVAKGGGIRVDGSIEIVNSTFTGNTGQSGGAISVAGEAEVSFSTFVDNTSNSQKGAGVDRNGGTMVITGSILTRANQSSSDGSDCSGNPDLIGANYVGNAQGCNPDETVLIGTDPAVGPLQVGPLADNLGPTQTMAIARGSVAVDAVAADMCNEIFVGATAATGMAVTTDQRGIARPQPTEGGCDLGAYEVTDLTVDVALTSDTATPFVGAELLPADAIASSVLATDRLFQGSLAASPLDAFPLEAAPLDAFPLDAFPLDAFPLDAFPLDAFDVAAAPLDAFPLDAFPLDAFPLDAFPLSDLVLTESTWDDLLAGTAFAGVPIQSLTLGDVISVPGVAALSLGQLNLEGTPLDAFPLTAYLLHSVPLDAFPLDAFGVDDWCDLVAEFCAAGGVDPATSDISLASLALAGVPLDAFPLDAFPLDAFPLDAFPLDAFPLDAYPLDAFQWQASPLDAFPLDAFPLDAFGGFIDCALLPGGTCAGATLGDAAAAGAFVEGTTLSHLGALLKSPDALDALAELGITLADVMIGVLPSDSIPWEQLDLSTLGLQNAADPARWTFDYLADVTLTDTAAEMTIELTLPPRFAFATTAPEGVRLDDIAVDPAAISLRCSDPSSVDCTDARTVIVIDLVGVAAGSHRLAIPARAGFVVEQGALARVDVVARAGSVEADAFDEHSVDVIAPDGEVRTIVTSGSGCGGIDGDANLGWTTSTGDIDLFTFDVSEAAARCGIRADIFLSNLDIDLDLTLYGEVAPALRGVPDSSMPFLDDVVLDLNPFDDQVQADTVQDIPLELPAGIEVGGTPIDPTQFSVVAISSNRDTGDDRIRTGTLRPGRYFIQVSAYNGGSTNEAYSLRLRTQGSVEPLECAAIEAPTLPTPGAMPTTIPNGINTLFLVNEQMLEFTYGQGARLAVVAAAQRVADAHDLGVIGAVIPVDSDELVREAYAARLADPCDPFAANDVVREIGRVIDGFTADPDANIENVVIIGDDRQIPMANIVDDANYANERTFAQEFDVANESTAALAAGMYRSDDPYGTDAGIAVRDHELFVPTRAVGRLVEWPADIIASLDNFVDFEGRLDDDTERNAFQSGYEFLEDGAELNATNLETADNPFTVDRLFGETWEDGDAVTELSTRHDVVGLHAHFDENNALPAKQNFGGVLDQNELLSSDELPLAVDESVVYSMGCHSGWSFSDIQVGATAPGESPDWAQALTADRSNVFAGNTGFGYGDSDRIALTEELTALFADEVGEDGSIGAAWVAAKQRMAGGITVLDAYQEKALQQFVLYGLPMFHVDTRPPDLSATATSSVEPVTTSAAPASATTSLLAPEIVTVDALNPLDGGDLGFELHETDDGDYYSIDDEVLTVNGHPVQPLRVIDLPAVPGKRARDAMITELSSQDHPSVFDPLFFWASPNFGGPRPEFLDGSFPAEMASIGTINARGSRQQQLLLAAGQYRASNDVADSGVQRLHTFIGADVYYVDEHSTDYTPPHISQSRGFVDDDAVLFEVQVDDTAERVLVLYRAEGAIDWQSVELTVDGSQWRGVGPFVGGPGERVEYLVQAADDAGNVAMSNSKSRYFLAAAPGDISELVLTADGPTKNDSGWFTGDVDVTATNGDEGAIFTRVDTGPFVPYTGPVTLDSTVATTRLVSAVDTTGAFFALQVQIDATNPTVAIEASTDWSNGPVSFEIAATDEGSGFERPIADIDNEAGIYYTLDGTDPTTASTPYTGPVVIATEGETPVRAIAVDVAGNTSDVDLETIRIDETATPPSLTITPTGAVPAGGSVTAAYGCTDALSGVASCVLTVDGIVIDGPSPATLPTDALGDRAVVVTATDVAGNTATTAGSYTVVDGTPPTASLSLNGTNFGLSQLATTSPVATYSCDDAAPSSGLASCQLFVDGVAIDSGVDLPTALLATPADEYSVWVVATDNAGLSSSSATLTYRIVDDIPPSALLVDLTIDQSASNGSVTADYSCFDNEQLVSCVLVVTDDDGNELFTDSSVSGALGVSLPANETGTYTVTVTATDLWGNASSDTDTYTYTALLCVLENYDSTQPKNVGTNYTIKIDLCDVDTPARQLELMATRILDEQGGSYDPGPNDSGSSNGGELVYTFRNAGKEGFIYNLNTTGFTGTPAPAGTLYQLEFTVTNTRTGELLGIGRARFTLTP